MEQLIAERGVERTAEEFAEIISRKFPDRECARVFILEEVDSASCGNARLRAFAKNSGIPAHEYRGAVEKSRPEIEGQDGPRQLLLELSFQLMGNVALMGEFRCSVNDKIMRRFALGKYFV